MEFRVFESIFQNENWQSIQLLKKGHDKIYNRDQITLDIDTVIITNDNSILMYDIKMIDGVQLFYLTVEEILQQFQQDVDNQGE